MTIDFPSNPTVGQIYSSPPQAWVWNGTAWTGGTTAQQASVIGSNKLLNPFMEIDQANEGGSINSATAHYVVDGWTTYTSTSGGGVWNGQRVAAAPTGYQYSATLATGTAASSVGAGDYVELGAALEGDDLYDTAFGTTNAQPLTLSFWAYCTIAGTYYVSLRNGPTANRTYVAPYTITAASVWQLVSITIPGDTGGAWTLSGNTPCISITWVLASGTTYQTANSNVWQAGNYFGITGMSNAFATTAGSIFRLGPAKLELGLSATPIQRTSFQAELARCQRYYEKSYDPGTAPGAINGTGQALIYSQVGAGVGLGKSTDFKVTKRASPTVTVYSPGTGAAGKLRDASANADVTATVGPAISSFFAFSAGVGATNGMIWQWVADARL